MVSGPVFHCEPFVPGCCLSLNRGGFLARLLLARSGMFWPSVHHCERLHVARSLLPLESRLQAADWDSAIGQRFAG